MRRSTGKLCAIALMWLIGALAMAIPAMAIPAMAQSREARFALVIGNDGYSTPLATAANDAGLVADTLRAAGFDVSGARDLDLDSIRAAVREFADKVAAAGPGSVAFVYLAGYGAQIGGANFFLPIGAEAGRVTDLPSRAVKLDEIRSALQPLPTKARIIVLDAARDLSSMEGGQELAGGLAIVEPAAGELIAFDAAPGTLVPPDRPPYGVYAAALAEMIRTGGLSLSEVFERVRLRVAEDTRGAVVPFDASQVTQPFTFLELAPDAPRPAAAAPSAPMRPIRDYSAEEAFTAAIARDTLGGYLEYLQAFPQSPYVRRVRAIIAARREALTWQRTVLVGTPQAYWSYLHRYPYGPHSYDARLRLEQLAAAVTPPPDFEMIDYGDLPPPPEPEAVFVERRTYVALFEPDFAPLPPPPEAFLPPPPPWWSLPPPPPPAFAVYFLPVPAPFIAPAYLAPPRYVAPPPPAPIYAQPARGHNAAAIAAGALVGAAAAAVVFELPRVVQRKVQREHNIVVARPPPSSGRKHLIPGQAIPGVPNVAQGAAAPNPAPQKGNLPPGAGRPLPNGPATSLPATPPIPPAGTTPGVAAEGEVHKRELPGTPGGAPLPNTPTNIAPLPTPTGIAKPKPHKLPELPSGTSSSPPPAPKLKLHKAPELPSGTPSLSPSPAPKLETVVPAAPPPAVIKPLPERNAPETLDRRVLPEKHPRLEELQKHPERHTPVENFQPHAPPLPTPKHVPLEVGPKPQPPGPAGPTPHGPEPKPPGPRRECGHPGQPPCPK